MKIRVSVHMVNLLAWALHTAMNVCCLIRIRLNIIRKFPFQHCWSPELIFHKGQNGTKLIITISWGQKIMHILPRPNRVALTITLSLYGLDQDSKTGSFSLLHFFFLCLGHSNINFTPYIVKTAHHKRNKGNVQPQNQIGHHRLVIQDHMIKLQNFSKRSNKENEKNLIKTSVHAYCLGSFNRLLQGHKMDHLQLGLLLLWRLKFKQSHKNKFFFPSEQF